MKIKHPSRPQFDPRPVQGAAVDAVEGARNSYLVSFEATIFVEQDELDNLGAVQAVQNIIGHTGAEVVEAERLGQVVGVE